MKKRLKGQGFCATATLIKVLFHFRLVLRVPIFRSVVIFVKCLVLALFESVEDLPKTFQKMYSLSLLANYFLLLYLMTSWAKVPDSILPSFKISFQFIQKCLSWLDLDFLLTIITLKETMMQRDFNLKKKE